MFLLIIRIIITSPPLWAPKCLVPPSRRRRQRSSSFPRPSHSYTHCCSCLRCQHSGEQSGLVTLTSDLENGVRVTCDVCYLCANFSHPRPLCSRLRPNVRIITLCPHWGIIIIIINTDICKAHDASLKHF